MDIGLDMYDDGRDADYMRWLEYQQIGRRDHEDDDDRPRRPADRKRRRRKTKDRDQ